MPEVVNYSIPDITVVGDINHNVPLKVNSDSGSFGTMATVTTSSNDYFLLSNRDRELDIEGTINFSAISDVATTFGVYVSVNDIQYLIDELPVTPTLQNFSLSISKIVQVKNGDKLYLTIRQKGTEVLETIQFSYLSNSTGINISEKVSSVIQWKKIYAVSLKDAFTHIISSASNGAIDVTRYIFENCLHEHYLTNNDGLQHQSSIINITLSKLFEELNNKYPASLSIYGDKCEIIDRCEMISTRRY